MRTPKPAGLVSFLEFARMAQEPKRKISRRLQKLHAADLEAGQPGDWLKRVGEKYLVNLSRLNAAHPALFAKRYVTREELEDVDAHLSEIDNRLTKTETRVKAHGSVLRDHAKAIDQNATTCTKAGHRSPIG